ncbi:MAG: ABC transporter [Ruminiclostridium sp.]|nr:ABC transporter [Ruminiclostridium sp.]MBQ8411441.1 ABC transporter [Ruminiclostridium sp.]
MLAVLKRELSAYFKAPVGYVFVAASFLFSGFFFWSFSLSSGSTDVSGVFQGMFYVYMIFVPILTMRLMAEDNRQKTDQLLLTAPVSLFGLVFGKFLSAYVIFLLGDIIMLIYGVVMSFFGAANWAMIFGNFVALALVGAIFVSSGLFISTLTESQMIAAIGSFALNLTLMLITTLTSVIPWKVVNDIIVSLSIFDRYYEFTEGIFSLSNTFFFLSVTVIFMFLTVRVLEKRRWA